MKPGDPLLLRRYSPVFPDSWVRGELPPHTSDKNTEVGIYLDSRVESDGDCPRTFYRVIYSTGVGWINSTFCGEM